MVAAKELCKEDTMIAAKELCKEDTVIATKELCKEDDHYLIPGRTKLLLKETRYARFCYRFWRILTLVSLAIFTAELIKSINIFGQYPVPSIFLIAFSTLALNRLVYYIMLRMNDTVWFDLAFEIIYVIIFLYANEFIQRNVISSALVCSCISTFIAYYRVSVYGDKPQLPRTMFFLLLTPMGESKDWTSWSHFAIVLFLSFYAQCCTSIRKPKDANVLDHFLSLIGDPINKQEDAVHFQL